MIYTYTVSVIEKTARALQKYAGKRIAVGVSGGRDSVCLLHAVISCGVIDKSDIVAIHVNHRLRDTADRDEAFVRDFCAGMGVAFAAYGVDVKKYAALKALSEEQAARELRYGVFYDYIKSGGADVIMTAHHALDNAESVLMHIFRGAGLDGLRGMTDPRIVRPFIDVYPEELDAYAAEHGITYMTDETNLDDKADRNYIRLNVLPLIERRYAGAVRAVNALSRECGEACDILDGQIDRSLICIEPDAVTVADAALNGPLAARYVREALRHFTLVDMTRLHIERAAALVNMDMGAVAELAHGVKAAREYGCVAFYIPREAADTAVPLAVGKNYIDGIMVEVASTDVDAKAAPRGTVADGDRLTGAVLRFRRDGDVFTPFGGGEKKLKQYLIDKKVPARLRDRLPLICAGSEVLVIVGMEISDKVRVTADTKNKVAVTRLPEADVWKK